MLLVLYDDSSRTPAAICVNQKVGYKRLYFSCILQDINIREEHWKDNFYITFNEFIIVYFGNSRCTYFIKYKILYIEYCFQK